MDRGFVERAVPGKSMPGSVVSRILKLIWRRSRTRLAICGAVSDYFTKHPIWVRSKGSTSAKILVVAFTLCAMGVAVLAIRADLLANAPGSSNDDEAANPPKRAESSQHGVHEQSGRPELVLSKFEARLANAVAPPPNASDLGEVETEVSGSEIHQCELIYRVRRFTTDRLSPEWSEVRAEDIGVIATRVTSSRVRFVSNAADLLQSVFGSCSMGVYEFQCVARQGSSEVVSRAVVRSVGFTFPLNDLSNRWIQDLPAKNGSLMLFQNYSDASELRLQHRVENKRGGMSRFVLLPGNFDCGGGFVIKLRFALLAESALYRALDVALLGGPQGVVSIMMPDGGESNFSIKTELDSEAGRGRFNFEHDWARLNLQGRAVHDAEIVFRPSDDGATCTLWISSESTGMPRAKVASRTVPSWIVRSGARQLELRAWGELEVRLFHLSVEPDRDWWAERSIQRTELNSQEIGHE